MTAKPGGPDDFAALNRRIRRTGFLAVLTGVFGVFAFAYGVFRLGLSTEKLNDLGSFVAGSSGSLWSLSGLLLIYIAFLGQRQQLFLQGAELELNREELRETREELRGQKEQLALQTEAAHRQQFDSTFFALLQLHNDIVQALAVSDNYGTHTQRAAFTRVYNELRATYGFLIGKDGQERADAAYERIYEIYGRNLGHYFRNLYHVIKFVDQSAIADKARYTAFVRAQLSTDELLVLFYNGASRLGREKFKPLIEKYALLKTLPADLLLDPSHSAWYADSAFGRAALLT